MPCWMLQLNMENTYLNWIICLLPELYNCTPKLQVLILGYSFAP